jgi:hypothetical protein
MSTWFSSEETEDGVRFHALPVVAMSVRLRAQKPRVVTPASGIIPPLVEASTG